MEAGRPWRRACTSSGGPEKCVKGVLTEELLEESGAYSKKEEVKVRMKAVLKHRKGYHMNQRSDPLCIAQKVRTRTNG